MERTWLQGGKTTNHQTLFPREPTTCLPKRRKWKTGIDINLITTARSQTQPNERLLGLSFVPSVVLHEFVFSWSLYFGGFLTFSCMFCNVWAEQKNLFFSCMFCNVWAEQKETWFFCLHVLQSHSKFKTTASQERSKSSTSVQIVTNSLFYLGLTSLSQFPIRIKYFLEFLDKQKWFCTKSERKWFWTDFKPLIKWTKSQPKFNLSS
jgi:hypothetical protein